MSRIRIATAKEVEEGKTVKFSFTRDDRPQEGFVGRFKGELFAYDNTCRHLPISLDYGDNRFFDSKSETLVCQHTARCMRRTPASARAGPAKAQACTRLR